VKGMPPSTSALSLSAEDLWPRLHHAEGSQSFLVRWSMFSGIPPEITVLLHASWDQLKHGGMDGS
jgi:hypothetical protein